MSLMDAGVDTFEDDARGLAVTGFKILCWEAIKATNNAIFGRMDKAVKINESEPVCLS